MKPFHVMCKPAGAACNLACEYCYYLEKSVLYPLAGRSRMNLEVLDRFIRDYIASQSGDEVNFAWQGGEPTLMGIDYFRKVVELQDRYANGRKITNALQTNGTLLNDEWAVFLKEENFLVGVSIDGPEDLHDEYRVTRGGRSSFKAVLQGWEVLQKREVEANTLTVIQRSNSQVPERVYKFLKEIGSTYLQFIPIVERLPDRKRSPCSLELAGPPDPEKAAEGIPVTDWSVRPRDFGTFLCKIFDLWVKEDVGNLFVQHFDTALGKWLGIGGGLCVFDRECGTAVAMEHNGDVYSCDHFVYPRYRLGNIEEKDLRSMIDSPEQVNFGQNKVRALPNVCRRCPYLFACNGDCPKHRFVSAGKGQPPLSYLCHGLKTFFRHIDPSMQRMAALYRSGRPCSDIMEKQDAAAAPAVFR